MNTENVNEKNSNLPIFGVVKRFIKLLMIPMLIVLYNIIAIVFIVSIPYWILTSKTLVKPFIDFNDKLFKFMES